MVFLPLPSQPNNSIICAIFIIIEHPFCVKRIFVQIFPCFHSCGIILGYVQVIFMIVFIARDVDLQMQHTASQPIHLSQVLTNGS